MPVNNKSFAKLKLGLYYFRKSVSRFSDNNWACIITYYRVKPYVLSFRKKNKKKSFFLSKSMPNFNFAKVQLITKKILPLLSTTIWPASRPSSVGVKSWCPYLTVGAFRPNAILDRQRENTTHIPLVSSGVIFVLLLFKNQASTARAGPNQ